MAKPLSDDLRPRVVAAVDGGTSRRAAARFGVSPSGAVRRGRVEAWRTAGTAGVRSRGGDRRPGRIEAFGAAILAGAEERAGIALGETAAPSGGRGRTSPRGARRNPAGPGQAGLRR